MPRDWNAYYSDPSNLDQTPASLLVEVAGLLPAGRALDLACGSGRNALYLASLGWKVTAVDSSPAAIRRLRESAAKLPIDARVADLESGTFHTGPGSYGLVCDFFFLQRNLFPQIREWIEPGGVFVAEIHLSGAAAHRHNPDYLLQPGELRTLFVDWKILFYSEAAQPDHPRPTARLIARRA